MSIWKYQKVGVESIDKLPLISCPFCKENLVFLVHKDFDYWDDHGFGLKSILIDVHICPVCGWWKAVSKGINLVDTKSNLPLTVMETNGAFAILKQFDIRDINAPIEEIRSFLAAKYELRFNVDPRLFEITVADVFRDFGYSTMVTAYTSDGGIDVILQDDVGEIGVQVKRHKSTIEVEQIRAFVGALVLKGYTRGMFVTTSKFSKGSIKSSRTYLKRGYSVELIDSKRFFDAIKIAQRPMYRSFNEFQQEYGLDLENLPHISAKGFF